MPSAGNIMGSMFRDSETVVHVSFLPHHANVNAQYYSNMLLNDVHIAIQKKRPKKLTKGIILLHDNAYPHTTNLTTLVTLGWETLNHPPYRTDLAASNYHLFRPM
jgi:hypothetical protein